MCRLVEQCDKLVKGEALNKLHLRERTHMCIIVIIHVTAKMAAALQFEYCLEIIKQWDLGITLV